MTARRRLLTGLALGGVLAAPMAAAQAVEQYPAPILHGAAPARLDAGALLTGSTDATPFGVDLSGLMVVDAPVAGAGAKAKTGPGIDTSAAGVTAQAPGFARSLRPFLGQPLSYKVIDEIKAAITRFYRENGRSLVLVSVPPQEITSGVLQVNVNTFRLEAPPVVAGDQADGAHIARQIRLQPGQEVDTGRLVEDVAWLNLNPFRRVSVAFEPGRQADGTRLTLQVQSKRPWSAYVGASNAGSDETGTARVFGGFNLSALPWQDQQLSYQVNASPGLGGLWDTEGTKGYVSHAFGYFIPVSFSNGFRVKARLGLDHVSSFAETSPIFSSGTTSEGKSLELAFPLPRRAGTWTLVPELYLGLLQADYQRRQFFAGTLFSTETTRLSRVELGLRSALNGQLFGRATHGDVDLALGMGRQETNGLSSDYRYLRFSLSQDISLEGKRGLKLRLAGQHAPDSLHPLEQLGLGGDSSVRGYPSNTASASSGASLSVEYRLAPIDLPLGGRQGEFRPHVFADWGVTQAQGGAASQTLASLGLGGSFTLGEQFEAAFSLAQALGESGAVEEGDVSVALRLVARF